MVARTWLAAGLGSSLAFGGLLFACSQSSPDAHGDKVINDTHPTSTGTTPPPPGDAGMTDVTYDDAYRIAVPDGYAPLAACKQCACSGSGSGGGAIDGGDGATAPATGGTFCFGGATGQYFNGTCAANEGGTLEIGCNPIPEACRAKPTCACILEQIPRLPCYPVCSVGNGGGSDFSVYCPTP